MKKIFFLLLIHACFISGVYAQCSITIQKVAVSRCFIAAGQSTSTVSIEIAWTNPPSPNDSIAVTVGTETRYVFTGMRTIAYDDTVGVQDIKSPQIIAFNLPADGSTGNAINAAFTQNLACSATRNFNLPINCDPLDCSGNKLGGQVFFDFNADGIKQPGETFAGQPGRTITAISKDNTIYTTTSARFGYWVLDIPLDKYPVRVEFSGLGGLREGTIVGTNGKSTVQFATSPSCSIDLGVLNDEDFSVIDPMVFVPCYVNGDPLNAASSSDVKDSDAIVGFPYSLSGAKDMSKMTMLAKSSEVGSTWGLAYNKEKKYLIASALLKRHVGLGPEGLGGLYFIDPAATTPSKVILSLDVNADLGINVGSVSSNSARGLATTASGPSGDADAYAKIGQVGIGDIDITDNGRHLFFVNLFDNKVYRIDLLTYNANGTPPTAADVTSYNIPDPGCVGGDFVPWALKQYKGLLYVGGVCNALSSQNKSDLRTYVYTLNINTGIFITAPAFDFPLTYPKGFAQREYPNETGWHPWTYDWNEKVKGVAGNGRDSILIHAEPILLDMDFDPVDESMVLAFGDLTGLQGGFRNYAPDGTGTVNINGTGNYNTINGGDILRALRSTGTSFVLENNGISGEYDGFGIGNGQGPGFGEFYNDNFYYDFDALVPPRPPFGIKQQHAENGVGGLAIRQGSGEVVYVTMDPIDNTPNSGGVRYLSNTTGDATKAYVLYTSTGTGSTPGSFAKASGLGDVELATGKPEFIEIGNRVWKDADKDGVQDPDEKILEGVKVALYKGTTKIAETETNSSGLYYFSNKNAVDPNLNWIGTGADTTLLPTTSYTLKFGETQYAASELTLGSDKLTLTQQGATANNGNNSNDSDATEVAGLPTITFTSPTLGAVNHTYDVGFYCTILPTITGKVTNVPATCVGITPQNNGVLQVNSAILGADKYRIRTGTSWSSAPDTSYATATTIGSSFPLGIQSGIPNAGATYIVRFYNGDCCYKDSVIVVPAVSCACTNPTTTAAATNATCTGSTVNADGSITLTGFTTEKYDYVTGSSYTGTATFATATAIPAGGVIVSNLPNPAASQAYTVRIFSSAGCFVDRTVTLTTVVCTIPCVSPSGITTTQNPTTCNGGTANNDGKIVVSSVIGSDKYGISVGGTYTGPNYDVAISLPPLPFDAQTAIPNIGGTYTIRFFSGTNSCFFDETITVATVTCCPSISYEICPGESYTIETMTGLTNIQWFRNGNMIPGSANMTYIASQIGTYTYTADQSASGCSGTLCCPVEIIAGTSCCTLSGANPMATCNDAGTGSTPSDDYFTVTLNPTGLGIGTTYSVSGGITANNIPYGSAQQVGGQFLISNGNINITITDDASGATCQLTNVTITAPAPCSIPVDRPTVVPPGIVPPCHVIDVDLRLGLTNIVDDTLQTVTDDGLTTVPAVATPGNTLNLEMEVYNNKGVPAYLVGWIDWNGNGVLDPATEEVISVAVPTQGTSFIPVPINIPTTVPQDVEIVSAFRLSTQSGLGPYGDTCAPDGEYENYFFRFSCPTKICVPITFTRN